MTATRSDVWSACRFLTCSVLPVRLACQCECPFCFSRSSISSLPSERITWTDEDLSDHFRWAIARGATRMVVTGGGEPLLRPDECLRVIRLASEQFDEIALFTNGANLDPQLAGELSRAGLSYLCWSRHEVDDDKNRELMGMAAPTADSLLSAAEIGGLAVRATCVMSSAGIADASGVWGYINEFQKMGVGQFTFKHTYVARKQSVFVSSSANAWSQSHRVESDPFDNRGEVVASLPWGPKIRRIGKVQVCHYFEPTPQWELRHRLARSSNLMSDGSVYASLEDQSSQLYRLPSSATTTANRSSTPIKLRRSSAPSRSSSSEHSCPSATTSSPTRTEAPLPT